MKTPLLTKIGKTVTDTLDWTAGKLSSARDAIRDLVGAERAIRLQHDAALAEREQLMSARPPMAEVLAELDKDLARVGRAWRDLHGPNLLATLAPSVDANGGTAYRALRYGPLEQGFPPFDLGTVAALFPDALKAGIVAAFPPFVEGPPMTARPALLAAVDARLRDLEAEHARLVDEAAEAGVALEHLESTRSRRLVDKAAAEWRARDAHDRARRVRE